MTTPTFFAWDNFEAYSDGPLSHPGGLVCWLAAGTTEVYFILTSSDNFNEYADGALPSPNLGFSWLAAGTTIYYPN